MPAPFPPPTIAPTMAPAPAPIPMVAASFLWVSPAVMSTGPRADGVLLTLENERVQVEGEASARLDAARRNRRGDEAADFAARRRDHLLPDPDVLGEPGHYAVS